MRSQACYSGRVAFRRSSATVLSFALRLDHCSRHERYRASIVFSYVFSGVPAICGKYRTPPWWEQSSLSQLCALRIFTVDNLLRDGREDVFAPLAVRARCNVGFTAPQGGRRKFEHRRSLGHFLSSWIFDSVFFCVPVARDRRISAD